LSSSIDCRLTSEAANQIFEAARDRVYNIIHIPWKCDPSQIKFHEKYGKELDWFEQPGEICKVIQFNLLNLFSIISCKPNGGRNNAYLRA
jgi:hypothetical protein